MRWWCDGSGARGRGGMPLGPLQLHRGRAPAAHAYEAAAGPVAPCLRVLYLAASVPQQRSLAKATALERKSSELRQSGSATSCSMPPHVSLCVIASSGVRPSCSTATGVAARRQVQQQQQQMFKAHCTLSQARDATARAQHIAAASQQARTHASALQPAPTAHLLPAATAPPAARPLAAPAARAAPAPPPPGSVA